MIIPGKLGPSTCHVTIDGEGRLTIGSITISKVTGLDEALSQKFDSTMTYGIDDISGLTSALNGKASLNATLAGDVSGTLPTSSVNKIKGYVAGTPTTSESYLKFNGSSLVWTTLPVRWYRRHHHL